MIKTPIADFIECYAESRTARMHMPGHKGEGDPLCRSDLTEISGADDLFSPDGIILQSEETAGEIFGADTLYSTEGSSLSIRAMLHLVTLYAKSKGKRPLIAATRNAHKAFVSAAALIDFEVDWIYSRYSSYLSSHVSEKDIEEYLDSRRNDPPIAVYITSPDYLG